MHPDPEFPTVKYPNPEEGKGALVCISLVVSCICENKDADQLRVSREADQQVCFRYIASTIPLLPKYKIPNLQPYSVVVQPGLCQTWLESPKTGFLTTRLVWDVTLCPYI